MNYKTRLSQLSISCHLCFISIGNKGIKNKYDISKAILNIIIIWKYLVYHDKLLSLWRQGFYEKDNLGSMLQKKQGFYIGTFFYYFCAGDLMRKKIWDIILLNIVQELVKFYVKLVNMSIKWQFLIRDAQTRRHLPLLPWEMCQPTPTCILFSKLIYFILFFTSHQQFFQL